MLIANHPSYHTTVIFLRNKLCITLSLYIYPITLSETLNVIMISKHQRIDTLNCLQTNHQTLQNKRR